MLLSVPNPRGRQERGEGVTNTKGKWKGMYLTPGGRGRADPTWYSSSSLNFDL